MFLYSDSKRSAACRRAARLQRRTGGFALAAMFGAMLLAGQAQAGDALHAKVVVVVENVAKLMHAQSIDAISIGQFSGPPTFPSASGPALVQMFHDEFLKHEIDVKARAKVGLAGEYSITETPIFDSQLGREVPQLAVKISGRLVDPFGSVLTNFNTQGVIEGKFEETVAGPETVVETIGLTAHLPADGTPHQIDGILRDSLVQPTHKVEAGNTRLRSSPDSPYAIEILVDGHACPIRIEDDLPFVEIRKGQTYAVKIYNESHFDAAANLLIDGMSVFTFSDVRETAGPKKGQPKYSVYIVKQGDSPILKGWHKTNQHVESFLVTDFAESAAARLGQTQDIGTITVTFAAAWPKGSPPPPDEFRTKGAGNATGFGPPLEHIVQEVQRDIGRVRDSVCIRYTK
ncbi:MAG: hypothetical protein R3B90_04380 [Planctomycetaceae bacterium]